VNPPIGWAISPGRTPYEPAVAFMEARAAAIAAGEAGELVWLVEHDSLYTAGVSAKPEDLLTEGRFPVFKSGRGGQFTYHGPGQRVAYVMLDLRTRGRDVSCYVRDLEKWIIAALARFNVKGEIRDGRIGVWVERKGPGFAREDKIAAIGVKIKRWATFHGVALNVEPDLAHFSGIVPCGIADAGVTSLVDLGHPITMDEVDHALRGAFTEVFGETIAEAAPKLAAG
jgi:lipoyl(octanoyl) transferase